MKLTIPHKTTREAAIRRVKDLLAESKQGIEQHASDVQTLWRDNTLDFSFSAQGGAFRGTLTVTDTDFEADIKLPVALRLFEGTLERMVRDELRKRGV